MAAAALRTRSTGAAEGRMAMAGISSFLSRARKSGRGRSPRRRSMSRCEYSGIGASHPLAQTIDRAQLQLLDGAFAFADSLGRFADAALVDEALDDDVALIVRQLVDEAEQTRTFFGALHFVVRWPGAARGLRIRARAALARRARRAIRDGIGRDADQPRAERCAAPLEPRERVEGLVKGL